MTEFTTQMFSQSIILDRLADYFNGLPPAERTFSVNDLPIFNVKVIEDGAGELDIIIGDLDIEVPPENYIGEATFLWVGEKGKVTTATAKSFFEMSKYINTGTKEAELNIKKVLTSYVGFLPPEPMTLTSRHSDYIYVLEVTSDYGGGTYNGTLHIDIGYNEKFTETFGGFSQTYIWGGDRQDELNVYLQDIDISKIEDFNFKLTQWKYSDYMDENRRLIHGVELLDFDGRYDELEADSIITTMTVPYIDTSMVLLNETVDPTQYYMVFDLTSNDDSGWTPETMMTVNHNGNEYTIQLYDGTSKKFALFCNDGDTITGKFKVKSDYNVTNRVGYNIRQYLHSQDSNTEQGALIARKEQDVNPGIFLNMKVDNAILPDLTDSDFVFLVKMKGNMKDWKGDSVIATIDGVSTHIKYYGGDERETWLTANNGQIVTFEYVSDRTVDNADNIAFEVRQYTRGEDITDRWGGEVIISIYPPYTTVGIMAKFTAPWTIEQTKINTLPYYASSIPGTVDYTYRIALPSSAERGWRNDFIKVYVDDDVKYMRGPSDNSSELGWVGANVGQRIRIEHTGMSPTKNEQTINITQFVGKSGTPSSNNGTVVGYLDVGQIVSGIIFDQVVPVTEVTQLPNTIIQGSASPDYKLIVELIDFNSDGINQYGNRIDTVVEVDGTAFPMTVVSKQYLKKYEVRVTTGQYVIFNHKEINSGQRIKITQYEISADDSIEIGEVIYNADTANSVISGQLSAFTMPWTADQDTSYIRPHIIQSDGVDYKYLIELTAENPSDWYSSDQIRLIFDQDTFSNYTALNMKGGLTTPYTIMLNRDQLVRFDMYRTSNGTFGGGLRVTQFDPSADVQFDSGVVIIDRPAYETKRGNIANIKVPYVDGDDIINVVPTKMIPDLGTDYTLLFELNSKDGSGWNWNQSIRLYVDGEVVTDLFIRNTDIWKYTLGVRSNQQIRLQFIGSSGGSTSNCAFKATRLPYGSNVNAPGDILYHALPNNMSVGVLFDGVASKDITLPTELTSTGGALRYLVELSTIGDLGWQQDSLVLRVGLETFKIGVTGTSSKYIFTADNDDFVRLDFNRKAYEHNKYAITLTQWDIADDYQTSMGTVVYSKLAGTSLSAGHVASFVTPFAIGQNTSTPKSIPLGTHGTDYRVGFQMRTTSSSAEGWPDNSRILVYVNGMDTDPHVVQLPKISTTSWLDFHIDVAIGDDVQVQHVSDSRYPENYYKEFRIRQWVYGTSYATTTQSLAASVGRNTLSLGYVAGFSVPWTGQDITLRPPTSLNATGADHTYLFTLEDSYGDGWQGSYFNVIHNGTTYKIACDLKISTFILHVDAGEEVIVNYINTGGSTQENFATITRYSGSLSSVPGVTTPVQSWTSGNMYGGTLTAITAPAFGE